MTKQEEIREGIAERLWGFKRSTSMLNLSNREWACLPDGAEKRLSRAMAKEIMGYEDSRGVVIKVERELLVVQWEITGKETPSQAQKIGNAFHKAYAGYVAVEPLIKE